ncbi:13613_t:CDS:2 [Funneliformis caledonium]|uniref:13613_t:CDS:1 n=1 Tax=Funneliformis caledonium TaxID=1117310 RepID=A0A9N9D742_9GLOM|nr:13613_t:CDS:2 [Funneliformis caledonium]
MRVLNKLNLSDRSLKPFNIINVFAKPEFHHEQTYWSRWIIFIMDTLQNQSNYATFSKMIKSLKSDDAQDAMNLLRIRFLGSLNPVRIMDSNELALVRFVISEGVLTHEGDFRNSKIFRISSPLIDLLHPAIYHS